MLIFLGSSMQNSSAMQLAVVGKSLPFVLAVSFSCTVAGTVKSCRQPGHADKAIEIVMFFFSPWKSLLQGAISSHTAASSGRCSRNPWASAARWTLAYKVASCVIPPPLSFGFPICKMKIKNNNSSFYHKRNILGMLWSPLWELLLKTLPAWLRVGVLLNVV